MIIPHQNIFDDLKKVGAEEIVVFARTGDGNVLVYGSHDTQVTGSLINDGFDEWIILAEEEGIYDGQ